MTPRPLVAAEPSDHDDDDDDDDDDGDGSRHHGSRAKLREEAKSFAKEQILPKLRGCETATHSPQVRWPSRQKQKQK